MRKSLSPSQHPEGILFSAVVLALILFFTYVRFFEVPYFGFDFNPSTGEVLTIYVNAEPAAALQEGDVLKEIGGVSWEDYATDAWLVFFENAKDGEVVNVTVSRNGEKITIPWVFPGFNPEEFRGRFINLWWLGYIFWVFGLLNQTFIRPRDARWRLLSAANYLTGLWVIVGSISASQVWGSSILLHSITWLLMPVFLNLHWVFPKPLKGMPAWGWVVLYLASATLAVGEFLPGFPRTLYPLGFLLMLVGSIALLIVHAVRQPAQRREVRLLGIAILVAVIPAIILGLAGITNHIPQIGPLALLALPIIPGAYFYIVYLQQLGGLELRANRFLSIYIYLTLLGAILLLLIAPAVLSPISQGVLVILSVVTASLTALISILAFPVFQRFVDQRLLGIRLPYQNLLETYSSRIATSTSIAGLLQLLEQDVFPSLLVRHYAFIELSNNSYEALLVKGIGGDELPGREEANELISLAGRYRPPAIELSHPWIRLILTLEVGDEIAGLWLLGRRDPDDAYHAAEIPILQSLANQTAIAMSNLLQTERIRKLYQLDIDRHEEERHRLALDLHDSILNQLAVLRMNIDESRSSPDFQQAYENLTQRLREIVSELRPPMLNYGLKLALEELTESLMERSGDSVQIMADIQAGEERYPQHIEQHLYRIAQEACENALRHAKAGKISIAGQMDAQKINLQIEDDGTGFDMGEHLELDDLLANNHFGLAGIIERASLIGAKANIASGLKTGTRIEITWSHPDRQDENAAPD
jgi:signal transduction histidine kinase